MGKTADSLLIKNDLTKDYVDFVKSMPNDYYSAITYDYGIDVHNNLFTTVLESGKTEETKLSVTALTTLYTEILKNTTFKEYANYVGMFVPSMKQAIYDICNQNAHL